MENKHRETLENILKKEPRKKRAMFVHQLEFDAVIVSLTFSRN